MAKKTSERAKIIRTPELNVITTAALRSMVNTNQERYRPYSTIQI